MRTTTDPRRLAGRLLMVGALFFLLFWLRPALEWNLSVLPWAASLAIHGVGIITISAGLVMSATVATGRWRALWIAGAALGVFGTFIGLPLFAVGMAILGISALLTPGSTRPGGLLVGGGVVWLVLFASGAMIGNEDYPPLDDTGRVLAVTGLILLSGGLALLGFRLDRMASPDRVLVGEPAQP